MGGGQYSLTSFLCPPGTDRGAGGGSTPAVAEAEEKREVGANDEEQK